MHKRTSVLLSRARWLMPLAALSMFGCPGQELAPLGPCTVSAVSERVDQSGISNVDLLFVIDNSGSMASEQVKIAKELPRLVQVLTEGDRCAGRPADYECPFTETTEVKRKFTSVKALHLGVISSNAGGPDEDPNVPAGQENLISCQGLGDDGKLQNSVEVAVNGVTAQNRSEFVGYEQGEVVLEPRSECDIGGLPEYQNFAAGEDDAQEVADRFACVATLGVRGCPFEQQLESMWKALAPSEGEGDEELYEFLSGSSGQGDRYNKGFLRDDAILAVIQVSDEEDCSIKEEGKDLFLLPPGGNEYGEFLNLRCGENATNENLIHPTKRYVDGLRSLKPGNEDRVLFAAIVGIPKDTQGQSFDEILERDDMQFGEDRSRPTRGFPLTSCFGMSTAPNGSTKLDEAYPPRRFLEVAKGLGTEQAVVYSICEEDYAPALDTIITRIASKLKGNCLPRVLTPNDMGKVNCEVFELLNETETKCSADRGHDLTKGTIKRKVRESGKIVERTACSMNQIAVQDKTLESGNGWYYDNFNDALTMDCQPGERQRIAFRFANAVTELPAGASATFECFQPVARIDPNAKGFDAVNTSCQALSIEEGDDICATRNDDTDNGYKLFCVDGTNTCQIKCEVNPDCPPGWVCAAGSDSRKGLYCQLPTCPQDSSNAMSADVAADAPGADET